MSSMSGGNTRYVRRTVYAALFAIGAAAPWLLLLALAMMARA